MNKKIRNIKYKSTCGILISQPRGDIKDTTWIPNGHDLTH